MPVIVQSGGSQTVVIDRVRTAAIVERRQAAVQAADTSATVAVASPGVQGPQGPTGSDAFVQTASEALGGHRVVRSTGNSSVGYASSDNPAHGDDTVGMTLNAAALGDPVTLITAGPIAFAGWTWTPGAPVFLGTNGLPTQVPPTTGFSQVIGHAEDATTLFLSIQTPTYFED